MNLYKILGALRTYQQYNGLRNDLDAYLYAVGEWALEDLDERPDRYLEEI